MKNTRELGQVVIERSDFNNPLHGLCMVIGYFKREYQLLLGVTIVHLN